MRNLHNIDDWQGTGFRVYTDGDEIFPSITTIQSLIIPPKLKAVIAKRTEAENQEVLKTTGSIGTRRDDIFTSIMDGRRIETTRDEQPYVDAFLECVEKHKIRKVDTQKVVYSDFLGVAGRVDLIGYFTSCGGKCCGSVPPEEYQNRLCIMDYKTGYYSPAATSQMKFYGMAYEELGLGRDLGVVGLQLPRNRPTYKCIVASHLDFVEGAVLGAIQVFRHRMFWSFWDRENNRPLWSHVNKIAWDEWAQMRTRRFIEESAGLDCGVWGEYVQAGLDQT